MARPRQSMAATARAPPPASCCHVMAASPMVQCALHKLGRHGVVAATRPPWAHHGRHTTPCHGRHSTPPPWPPQHWHACHGPHRPQHECTTPPPPPCRHGRHNTRQHSCWPCCPMGATARPHHGCHSTPPPWAPQHTPSEMAAWPWPATAPTCPLAHWLTVGRLLAPWAHWWGPHALGGCFAFFLHFAGCS
jgi:hypothetical protein